MTTSQEQPGTRPGTDGLAGGGEMGERVRAFDWAQTPLGPAESWPQSLRTAVRIMLNSRYPMFVWWGPELINLYNDAYVPILGKQPPRGPGPAGPGGLVGDLGHRRPAGGHRAERRPGDLGRRIAPPHGAARLHRGNLLHLLVQPDSGRCRRRERRLLRLHGRHRASLGERRLETLRDLGERSLAEARTDEQVCRGAALTLAENPHDFPFALIYLLDETGRVGAPLRDGRPCRRNPGEPRDDQHRQRRRSFGRFRRVLETSRGEIVENLIDQFGRLPAGAWAETGRSARPCCHRQQRSPGKPRRLPGRRPQPPARARRRLPRFPRSRRRADRHGHRQRPRLRGGAQARRSAGRARPRQDGLLQQRQPRVPHAADADAGAAGRHAGPTPRDCRAEDRERLDVAHRNGLRLLKLVNTLLDFSRIEAGRIQASYEPTDLAALTADLASIFRSAIERAGCSWSSTARRCRSRSTSTARCGRRSSSTCSPTPSSSPSRARSRSRCGRPGMSVELAVRDTGTGIPAEELPQLVRAVPSRRGRARAHARRHRDRPGAGPGVGPAARRRRCASRARWTGERPSPSAFRSAQPTCPSTTSGRRTGSPSDAASRREAFVEEALRWLPERRRRARPEIPAARRIREPARSRILLADDNADMRDYVRRLLQPEATRSRRSRTARPRWRSARQQPPDLVLTDVMMPGLDGFGLLRELRADERYARAFRSSCSRRARARRAAIEGLEAGADDYLIKPFSAPRAAGAGRGASEAPAIAARGQHRAQTGGAQPGAPAANRRKDPPCQGCRHPAGRCGGGRGAAPRTGALRVRRGGPHRRHGEGSPRLLRPWPGAGTA